MFVAAGLGVAAAGAASPAVGAGPAAATGARANAGGAASPAAGMASPAAGADSRFAPVPGPYAVEAMNLDWFDRDRNRQVPARVYFPRHEPGPFPVVVFSSGLGAGRNNFEFLGRHLASHGYVSVHVQHVGDDDQAEKSGADARGALRKAARDPRAGLTRLLDVVFALDQVGALASSSPVLRGRIDLGAVAVAGNNLGAWTALAAAGLATMGKDGEESSLPDPRVKAALLFFPPPAAVQGGRLRFEHVKVPCLHVVGTPAGDHENDAQAAAKRLAFDRIAGVDQVLVRVPVAAASSPAGAASGAGAADRSASAAGRGETGAGRGTGAAGTPEPEGAKVVPGYLKAISTAFLDAYLRHDTAAKNWLDGGGLAAYLGAGARVETRSK
jgi:Platelet-activating factor acetylhydrolase, isoform II